MLKMVKQELNVPKSEKPKPKSVTSHSINLSKFRCEIAKSEINKAPTDLGHHVKTEPGDVKAKISF